MEIINIECCSHVSCGKFRENESSDGFVNYYCYKIRFCNDCILYRSIPKLYMDMED